jgi:hypothetical protein
MGYDVKINDPLQGRGAGARVLGSEAQRHSLQIEANRRLYMDEKTRERTSSFATLKANLDKMLEESRSTPPSAPTTAGHDHHHHDHDHDHGHHHDHDHDHTPSASTLEPP